MDRKSQAGNSRSRTTTTRISGLPRTRNRSRYGRSRASRPGRNRRASRCPMTCRCPRSLRRRPCRRGRRRRRGVLRGEMGRRVMVRDWVRGCRGRSLLECSAFLLRFSSLYLFDFPFISLPSTTPEPSSNVISYVSLFLFAFFCGLDILPFVFQGSERCVLGRSRCSSALCFWLSERRVCCTCMGIFSRGPFCVTVLFRVVLSRFE